MKVFIDTNIYLSLIRCSDEKLKSIEELKKLIDEKKIDLIFPRITQDEFSRNFPGEKKKYLDELSLSIPRKPNFAVLLKGTRSKAKTEKAYDNYVKSIEALKLSYSKSLDEFIEKNIKPLIDKSERFVEDDNFVNKAHLRRLKGNPPGKKSDPLGDEIEWEILLNLFSSDDLSIITADNDWRIKEDQNIKLKPFLEQEWRERSAKDILIYSTIGEFINKYTNEEKVSEEDIKEEREAIDFTIGTTPVWFSGSNVPSRQITFGTMDGPGGFFSADNEQTSYPFTFSSHMCSRCGEIFELTTMIKCPKCGQPVISTS